MDYNSDESESDHKNENQQFDGNIDSDSIDEEMDGNKSL